MDQTDRLQLLSPPDNGANAVDIFAAKTKIRTLNEIAEEEEMEKQLEQLLFETIGAVMSILP